MPSQKNWNVHHQFPHFTIDLFHFLNKAVFCFSLHAVAQDNTGPCKDAQSRQFLCLLEYISRLLFPKHYSDTATKIQHSQLNC